MPGSTVIFSQLSKKAIFSAFSIVGKFSQNDPDFVSHVALLDGSRELPNEVQVYHMRPPLVSDPSDPTLNNAHVLLEPNLAVELALNERQVAKIARWAARIATENGPTGKQRYTILPAVNPSVEIAENGSPKYHRFSCAGYVSEALRKGGVLLCKEDNLPLADLQALSVVYPYLHRAMKKTHTRQHLGIETDPPWPVLLPGYLFHGADHFLENGAPVQPTIDMARYPSKQSSS